MKIKIGIPSVDNTLKYLLSSERRRFFITIYGVAIYEILLIGTEVWIEYLQRIGVLEMHNIRPGFSVLFLIPIVATVSWIHRTSVGLSRQKSYAIYKAFADKHAAAYSEEGMIAGLSGSAFNPKNHDGVTDIVLGKANTHSFRLFGLVHVDQEDKTEMPVLEFEVAGTLPKLLVINHQVVIADIKENFAENHKIILEGDFPSNFDLYGNSQNEIIARQVFTPDTMATLVDLMSDRSENPSINAVEISGNKIYVYGTVFLENTKQLEDIFAVGTFLAEKLDSLSISLMNSDIYSFAATNNYSLKEYTRPIGSALRLYFETALYVILAIYFIYSLFPAIKPAVEYGAITKTSNTFIHSIQNDNYGEAKSVTSPTLRESFIENLVNNNSPYASKNGVTYEISGWKRNDDGAVNAAAVVYTFKNSSTQLHYLELFLKEKPGGWLVTGYQLSEKPINI